MCLVLVSFLGPAGDPKMVKEHLPSMSLWVTPASPRDVCAKASPAVVGKGGDAEGTWKERRKEGAMEEGSERETPHQPLPQELKRCISSGKQW